MTVWITGANGFIGRHLAGALTDAGHAVHGVGHGALEDTDRQRLGLRTWLNGEIDAANLNALAGSSGLPSTIFHLAGGSSVGLSIAHRQQHSTVAGMDSCFDPGVPASRRIECRGLWRGS
jgi:UDP-glucose 4-epimerase